jgi:hypothetical protein
MSGAHRSGVWRPARRGTVLAVMGSGDIDLRHAELEPVTTLRVITIMGGHHVQLGTETPPPDAPVLRLRLLSIMGGVHVRRRPPPSRP